MSENVHHELAGEAGHAGHVAVENEPDTAKGGFMGLLLASLAIILAITSYFLWIYFQREAEAITYEQVLSRPAVELQALRAVEEEELRTAGVVDAEQGIYRVPLQHGIQLFLKDVEAREAEGLPQRIQAPAVAEEIAEGEAEAGTEE